MKRWKEEKNQHEKTRGRGEVKPHNAGAGRKRCAFSPAQVLDERLFSSPSPLASLFLIAVGGVALEDKREKEEEESARNFGVW